MGSRVGGFKLVLGSSVLFVCRCIFIVLRLFSG